MKDKCQGRSIRDSGSEPGVHDSRVVIDLAACTGCLKCHAVCPVSVFTIQRLSSGHVKVFPSNEQDCLECLACELLCPVDAIHIVHSSSRPSSRDTLNALLHE